VIEVIDVIATALVVSGFRLVRRALVLRADAFRTAVLVGALVGRFFLTERLFMEQYYIIRESYRAKNIVLANAVCEGVLSFIIKAGKTLCGQFDTGWP
jgi:hypothetical protein